MKIGDFDLDKKVMVVAEIGNNHEGDFALAEQLISLAADTGADAVKFQTFTAEQYITRRDKDRFARLKSFEFSAAQFQRLSVVAVEVGVLFLSTPFDLPSVKLLEPLVSAFKISSGDNTFYPLIEAVAKTDKPVILSTGLATLTEIQSAIEALKRNWSGQEIADSLAILHCVSSYPVKPAEANLGAIKQLGEKFNCTIGYSDHTTGIDAAALSVALGARVVEKHFTVDKNHSDFRDHQLSADPIEFRELVERIRQYEILLGDGAKKLQESEIQALPAMRRSIAAINDLDAGITIEAKHLTWVRPACGFAPGQEESIIGKRLLKSVEAGDALLPEMFAQEVRM